MLIPPDLAAELALLTKAIDLRDADVAETLTRLVATTQNAVESYLGLSVAITIDQTTHGFTVLNDGVQPEQIRSSLLVPLPAKPASVALILYAATPGAFIDLAADLACITGRELDELRLDEHRTFSAGGAAPTQLRVSRPSIRHSVSLPDADETGQVRHEASFHAPSGVRGSSRAQPTEGK